jgi:hypothetical protein
MNKVFQPKPVDETASALSADARRRAAMDQLLALFRETSAEAKAAGLTEAEIDAELALHKVERRV